MLDADRVLLRAFADAAFQDAAQRHGSVPRWLIEMAGTAAAGELDERLALLHRRALAGDREVLRVDAEDAGVAEQTGAAALVFLTERGQPQEVRYLLEMVADGDGADTVMARLARQPDGTWSRAAAIAYRLKLGALDAEPWQVLRAAEVALAESGGAGLDASLPAEVPAEIGDEVLVLRARAAADEGDLAAAAEWLAQLSDVAAQTLRDPAAALSLRIRVESRAGGDAGVARRLALQLDADFPRSAARIALRQKNPLLGMEEDPQRWLATMRARIEASGTDDIELKTLERYARTLLIDHRVGAAAGCSPLSRSGARPPS